MANVNLFKRTGEYTDKRSGEKKPYTNFYVQCGDQMIPVEVSYFGTEEEPDRQYAPRRAIMSAFSDRMPEREKKAEENAAD